jgi:pimeloyl-ACP methyl ester carboxylesterase
VTSSIVSRRFPRADGLCLAADVGGNPEGVAALRDKLPGLEVFNVDNAGHMVAGHKNDAFNRGVLDFLSRPSPRSG